MQLFGKRKTSTIPLMFLIVVTLLGGTRSAKAANLNISLVTNKEAYGSGETVVTSGNLTLEGYGFRVGLVAIEIETPFLTPFVFRTMKTGPLDQQWNVSLTDVYSCDQYGNRTSAFHRDGYVYIKVEIANNSTASRQIWVAIYIQYSDNVPFVANIEGITLPPGSTGSVQPSIYIPIDAPTGLAQVYASLFTNYPKTGGLPYCPEGNTTFTITSGTQQAAESPSLTTSPQTGSISSFTFNFTISRANPIYGNYTIYASSQWQNYTAYNSKVFQVVLVGDLNGDHLVDMTDIGIAALAYGSKPGNPRWNPIADINNDGTIDMTDIGIIAFHYGEHL